MDPEEELQYKLEKIGSVFDIEKIIIDKTNKDRPSEFKRVGSLPYSLLRKGIKQFFTTEEAHITDVMRCEDFVERYLEDGVKTVLEVTIRYRDESFDLAAKYPDVHFFSWILSGSDVQHELERMRGIPNLKSDLRSVEDIHNHNVDSLDLSYSIESLSLCQNQTDIIKDVFSNLRKEGRFVVVDQYLHQQFGPLSKHHLWLKHLVGRSVALSDLESYDLFKDRVTRQGMRVEFEGDLTDAVIPESEKVSEYAGTFFNRGIVAKAASSLLPDDFAYRIISAYLMPTAMRLGMATYRVTVFKKDME